MEYISGVVLWSSLDCYFIASDNSNIGILLLFLDCKDYVIELSESLN